MSSTRCGDSSCTDYSGHRSTHSRNKGQSHKSSCRRHHSRSRSRSPHRGSYKRSRNRSRSPRLSHHNSHHSSRRSRSHHVRHSDYSSHSHGRRAHGSHGGSRHSSDRRHPYSGSQGASNRYSPHLEQWSRSESITTGRWSHDGFLHTFSSCPDTNAVTLSLEEGLKLAVQGSRCTGCAQAPIAEVMPDCAAGYQAPPPSLPPRPIEACCSSDCATTKSWCDVDIMYDPPRFRAAEDLAVLRRPPPQPHMRFRGMHRTYAGCDVMVATTPADVKICLHLLEPAMNYEEHWATCFLFPGPQLSDADGVIAIDLEWKADTDKDQDNRVALIQLASSSMVLLIKTTGLDFMPAPLETFLRKEGRTFLGLGWGSADEKKMRKSFNFGRDDFARFIDLQDVLAELGYPNNEVSIPSITFNCFGLTVLSMSSMEMRTGWDTPILSVRQVVYAARDALLTAYAYRQLRAWHDAAVNPVLQTRICEACGRAFGVPTEWQMGPTAIRCLEAHCRKTFTTSQALADHACSTKHAASHVQCHSCNRLCCIE